MFFISLEVKADELVVTLRRDGIAIRKQLVMFGKKMMQKNAATSIPYRIQFSKLMGFL